MEIRPRYYVIELPDGYELEVRLLIEALGANFYLGAAIKHLCRAGRKGPTIEDLSKAATYIGFERDRLLREAAEAVEGDEPDDGYQGLSWQLGTLIGKVARINEDLALELELVHGRLARQELHGVD